MFGGFHDIFLLCYRRKNDGIMLELSVDMMYEDLSILFSLCVVMKKIWIEGFRGGQPPKPSLLIRTVR